MHINKYIQPTKWDKIYNKFLDTKFFYSDNSEASPRKFLWGVGGGGWLCKIVDLLSWKIFAP